jgi:hypothetical protein
MWAGVMRRLLPGFSSMEDEGFLVCSFLRGKLYRWKKKDGQAAG